MAEEKLYFTFEQDTRSFIHQINELLIKLENSGYNKDVINQIFRCIHSIKSEAAYLKLDDIAEAAHDMETAIEPLRDQDGEVLLNSELLEFCFSIIDGISAGVENIIIPRTEDIGAESSPDIEEEDLQDLPRGCYSDFELLLLNEARSRGERLYRLSFGVAEDESMKYPRAYLALSNLEMKHNVIKVRPEIDEIDEHGWDRITLVISSASSDHDIANEINIDQIENIEIIELSYEDEFRNLPEEEEEPPKAEENQQRVISVEVSEIDAITNYVAEIKSRLADLSTVINSEEAKEKLDNDLQGLETISNGIEKMMTNLQTVDFNTHFAGYRRTARDLSARLGKKLKIEFDSSSIKILRDFADFIAEPLLQLIRNAVVHGIESPGKRAESGKLESGLLRISAERDDKALIISVEDDGAGVSVDTGSERDLLSIISSPGFSTHGESADYAGRGVGLDLVQDRIQQRNGRLELVNRPGNGCIFKMIFTEGKTEIAFLVVRLDEFTCAIKTAEADSVFSIPVGEIRLVDGNYCYDGEILYTPYGRMKDPGKKTIYQGLRMSYLGKKGILVFDESLFEVRYGSDAVSEGFDVGSYCRELIINGKPAEYSLLTSQVLFD